MTAGCGCQPPPDLGCPPQPPCLGTRCAACVGHWAWTHHAHWLLYNSTDELYKTTALAPLRCAVLAVCGVVRTHHSAAGSDVLYPSSPHSPALLSACLSFGLLLSITAPSASICGYLRLPAQLWDMPPLPRPVQRHHRASPPSVSLGLAVRHLELIASLLGPSAGSCPPGAAHGALIECSTVLLCLCA